MSVRTERVAEAIREELMDIIQKDLKDPRIGIASVTHVDVSRDLKHAHVLLSVLGDNQEKADCLECLTKAAGRIKNELGKRIRLRTLPELSFTIDMTVEHSLKIAKILHELKVEGTDEPGE